MDEENRQNLINLLNELMEIKHPDNRDDSEKLLDKCIPIFAENILSIKLTESEADEIKDAIYKDYVFPTKHGVSIVSEDVRNDKWLDEKKNQVETEVL